MYKVYCDDLLVYDPTMEDLALVDPVVKLALNDAGSFTFTVPDTHPYKDVFKPLTSTIRVYRDGVEQPLFIGRIIMPEGDFNNSMTYTCEGALAYLNDSIQPPAEFHDITPMGYVGVLLDQHNQQVKEDRQIKLGAITVTDPNNSLYRYTNNNSTLQELKEDILDDLGGYCRIREEKDGLYLDIVKDYGVRNEQMIEFGENLIDFQKNTDFTEMVTVIKPLGAKIEELNEGEIENNENDVLDERITIEDANQGSDYLINQDLYDKYGAIWRTVTWDDVHSPKLLLQKAQEWMMEQDFESLVIDAKAFDFSYIDGGMEAFHLGDEIRVKSKPHNIDRWFLLSQMEIHLDSLSQNTITLGGKGRPIALSDITTQITVKTNELDDMKVLPNKLIKQAINQATQLINSMTHGYVVMEPNEILIMDTPDKETAKNLWRWNMGGLGFSHNGYQGPFETAITMDGTIVGKFLAANSIAAEKIDVNYRTQVDTNIKNAELGANGYTDSKLKLYWTSKEVETQLQTTQNSILASVNVTLRDNYYNSREIDSKFTITEGNIKSYVSDTLKAYSTTSQVQSLIDQKADSITLSVSQKYATKDALGNVQTSLKSVEQKVTVDGIFTTINSGIKGSQQITNTKFSMTSSGLTVQGGGITIKNKAGSNVLYADTSGNLTLQGKFVQYTTSGRKSVEIVDNEVKIYAWNYDGNYVGSLGSPRDDVYRDYPIGLWCDWGDDIILGYRPTPTSTAVQPIIRLGSKQSEMDITEKTPYGIKFIKGTAQNVTHYGAGKVLQIRQGLVVNETEVNPARSTTYRFPWGGAYLAFSNGVLSGYGEMHPTVYGNYVQLGNGYLKVTDGLIESVKDFGGKSNVVDLGGGGNLSVTNGLITGFTNSRLGISYVPITNKFTFPGGGSVQFQNGIAIAGASSKTGINFTYQTAIGWHLYFENGILTRYTTN